MAHQVLHHRTMPLSRQEPPLSRHSGIPDRSDTSDQPCHIPRHPHCIPLPLLFLLQPLQMQADISVSPDASALSNILCPDTLFLTGLHRLYSPQSPDTARSPLLPHRSCCSDSPVPYRSHRSAYVLIPLFSHVHSDIL